MHKFPLVICYKKLTSFLKFIQSFSYPELLTPLLMLVYLEYLLSNSFYLSSSQLISIFQV